MMPAWEMWTDSGRTAMRDGIFDSIFRGQGPAFKRSEPGKHFPISWGLRGKISDDNMAQAATVTACSSSSQGGMLHALPDFDMELPEDATPVFDEVTEDQTRFRIYDMGTMELRTI